MEPSQFSEIIAEDTTETIVVINLIEPVKRGLWKTLNYDSKTENLVEINT